MIVLDDENALQPSAALGQNTVAKLVVPGTIRALAPEITPTATTPTSSPPVVSAKPTAVQSPELQVTLVNSPSYVPGTS